MSIRATVREILRRLRDARIAKGMSENDMENLLILGPGWLEHFESGLGTPSLDLLLAMLHHIDYDPATLFSDIDIANTQPDVERQIYAEDRGTDLRIHFRYAQHDAVYDLPKAKRDQFDAVQQELRDGLARLANSEENDDKAIKADSVVRSFLTAVQAWPHANPSDLWWFIVYRAYCDPFNHPARFARLELNQSWKRTAGWALEQVLVRHYGRFLRKHGVKMFIPVGEEKIRLVESLEVRERLEADKVDVILVGVRKDNSEECFGVVHVKASFAERRTDDVPMSQALVSSGYCSPLWTMDCKSAPSTNPINRGELGAALSGSSDRRSAKRKDIEDDGYFSACFSYNSNTVATPSSQAARARIVTCDFRNPNDLFSQYVIREWDRRSS